MEYFITHNVGEPARTALQSIIDGIQTQFAVTRLQLPPTYYSQVLHVFA